MKQVTFPRLMSCYRVFAWKFWQARLKIMKIITDVVLYILRYQLCFTEFGSSNQKIYILHIGAITCGIGLNSLPSNVQRKSHNLVMIQFACLYKEAQRHTSVLMHAGQAITSNTGRLGHYHSTCKTMLVVWKWK